MNLRHIGILWSADCCPRCADCHLQRCPSCQAHVVVAYDDCYNNRTVQGIFDREPSSEGIAILYHYVDRYDFPIVEEKQWFHLIPKEGSIYDGPLWARHRCSFN